MKRGVSSLIAAVLLIVFVVTMLVVIFNLTRESVEPGFEKGEGAFEGFSNCDEVKFFVEDAYCDGGLVIVKVKNEKKIDFKDGFAVRFFHSNDDWDVGSFLYDTRLNAYEVKAIGISRPTYEAKGLLGEDITKYKAIQFLEVVPRVKSGEGFQFCADKKKKIEVKNCSGN